jgi:hypothetical protein
VIFYCDIPKCKGVLRHLWTNKCVSLYNDNGIIVEEGISHRFKSDLVVRSTGPLKDTQIAVQISKRLKVDEFPNDWKYYVQA